MLLLAALALPLLGAAHKDAWSATYSPQGSKPAAPVSLEISATRSLVGARTNAEARPEANSTSAAPTDHVWR